MNQTRSNQSNVAMLERKKLYFMLFQIELFVFFCLLCRYVMNELNISDEDKLGEQILPFFFRITTQDLSNDYSKLS